MTHDKGGDQGAVQPGVQPAALSLGRVLRATRVPNERHLHWLWFAAQEFGRVPREYEFEVSGGEAFSRELDLTLAVMEASGLVVDTGTGASLLLTAQGSALVEGGSLELGGLAALSTSELVAVGRVIQLTHAGVSESDMVSAFQHRFLAEPWQARTAVNAFTAMRAQL
jgi:hypothetical protein